MKLRKTRSVFGAKLFTVLAYLVLGVGLSSLTACSWFSGDDVSPPDEQADNHAYNNPLYNNCHCHRGQQYAPSGIPMRTQAKREPKRREDLG